MLTEIKPDYIQELIDAGGVVMRKHTDLQGNETLLTNLASPQPPGKEHTNNRGEKVLDNGKVEPAPLSR
jgi:hypothetical protein